jgi:hypothetical protein
VVSEYLINSCRLADTDIRDGLGIQIWLDGSRYECYWKNNKDYVGPFGHLYFKSRRNRSNSPTDAKSGSVTRFISSKDLNQEAVRNDSNARGGANGAAADMSDTRYTLKEMTAEANAVPGERSVYYKDVGLIRESVTET